jgi:glycosyltransferase involved in cell wall biosynthesis
VGLNQQHRRFSTQVGPLTRSIREIKPVIVHSRNWGAMEAVVSGRWVGSCSIIHSEHGVETDAPDPRRRTWLRRAVFEMADHIFSVSHHLRDTLVRRTGFPARRMGVIHNGVDMQRFRRHGVLRAQHRAQFGIASDEFCIGSVGRCNRIKDYPTLLRAAELLDTQCRSWRLLIIGDGADRPALEKMVQASPALSGRVHLLGSSPYIPEFLNAIDAYVIPSLLEGISNSLLEAMASGVAVIASERGGNPEVVVDGECGLLFQAGDVEDLARRLLLLYREPERREQLAQAATERVREHFSLASMIRQYEELYETMAQRFTPYSGAARALAS